MESVHPQPAPPSWLIKADWNWFTPMAKAASWASASLLVGSAGGMPPAFPPGPGAGAVEVLVTDWDGLELVLTEPDAVGVLLVGELPLLSAVPPDDAVPPVDTGAPDDAVPPVDVVPPDDAGAPAVVEPSEGAAAPAAAGLVSTAPPPEAVSDGPDRPVGGAVSWAAAGAVAEVAAGEPEAPGVAAAEVMPATDNASAASAPPSTWTDRFGR